VRVLVLMSTVLLDIAVCLNNGQEK